MASGPSAPDALLAAALLAVDPAGLGGVVLRAAPGPARERWLDYLQQVWPGGLAPRRVPPSIADHRLLGGVDLVATLAAGRPVAERGVLADADGGVALLAMAERLPAATAARIAGVLEAGRVATQRDGLAIEHPARLAVVALDEGLADDEQVPAVLAERCAIWLPLDEASDAALAFEVLPDGAAVEDARAHLPRIDVPVTVTESLCAAAAALGIDSMRVAQFASRLARASAALHGRDEVAADDIACAAHWVLAPRARCLPPVPAEAPAEAPQPPADAAPDPAPADAPAERADDAAPAPDPAQGEALPDQVLAAVAAALPAGLLAQLQALPPGARKGGTVGRAGAQRIGRQGRGRLTGARPGAPGGAARLSVIDTLRAAAPWQPLRRRELGGDDPGRVLVRREDFRVRQIKQRTQTTTLFVVDASGSAAAHRLAEAKGAVELLLAECYVRRDKVALIAFRGRAAELLLPPTRSLVRAKRRLSALPGGGGTPLANAIDATRELAAQIARRGDRAVVVILSDGQANVARDGSGGRAKAQDEARSAARQYAEQGCRTLFIDTAPRGSALALELATALNARYLSLPQADARQLSGVVQRSLRVG